MISKTDIIKFIDYAKKSKSTKISDIILGTEYTENYAYRVRSELNNLKLLKTFIPDIPVCDIDFDKVEIWKRYKLSDNWYIYSNSDRIRTKFEDDGINYDELDLDDWDVIE